MTTAGTNTVGNPPNLCQAVAEAVSVWSRTAMEPGVSEERSDMAHDGEEDFGLEQFEADFADLRPLSCAQRRPTSPPSTWPACRQRLSAWSPRRRPRLRPPAPRNRPTPSGRCPARSRPASPPWRSGSSASAGSASPVPCRARCRTSSPPSPSRWASTCPAPTTPAPAPARTRAPILPVPSPVTARAPPSPPARAARPRASPGRRRPTAASLRARAARPRASPGTTRRSPPRASPGTVPR